MKEVFRTKYSWWMTGVCFIAPVFLIVMMLVDGFSWAVALSALLIAVFFADMVFGTRYTIEDNRLYLRAGILFNATLDIAKIESIERVHSIINDNSFAWSADRLLITMPRRTKFMVSPVDADRFVKALLAVNPEIAVVD